MKLLRLPLEQPKRKSKGSKEVSNMGSLSVVIQCTCKIGDQRNGFFLPLAPAEFSPPVVNTNHSTEGLSLSLARDMRFHSIDRRKSRTRDSLLLIRRLVTLHFPAPLHLPVPRAPNIRLPRRTIQSSQIALAARRFARADGQVLHRLAPAREAVAPVRVEGLGLALRQPGPGVVRGLQQFLVGAEGLRLRRAVELVFQEVVERGVRERDLRVPRGTQVVGGEEFRVGWVRLEV